MKQDSLIFLKINLLFVSIVFELCVKAGLLIKDLANLIHESDVVEGGPLPNFLLVWYILFIHQLNPTKKIVKGKNTKTCLLI